MKLLIIFISIFAVLFYFRPVSSEVKVVQGGSNIQSVSVSKKTEPSSKKPEPSKVKVVQGGSNIQSVSVSKKPEPSSKKPEPSKVKAVQNRCNTKLGIVFNNCAGMYDIYKEKYSSIVTPDGNPNITAQIVCNLSAMITAQERAMYEERCDENIYPRLKKAIFGLACYQVSNGMRMLYKSEYCKIYKDFNENKIKNIYRKH